MKGFIFKTASITLVFVAAFFSTSLLAANPNGAAGCMACHQGAAMQSDDIPEKNHATVHPHKQASKDHQSTP
jgi:hypothetical protein